MARVKNPSLYRALHKLRKGGLHRALGVAEGEKIPAAKLEAARNSKNAHVRKMANFAHTMKSWKH
jgi:DNA-binding PadR family transcriptional regulator